MVQTSRNKKLTEETDTVLQIQGRPVYPEWIKYISGSEIHKSGFEHTPPLICFRVINIDNSEFKFIYSIYDVPKDFVSDDFIQKMKEAKKTQLARELEKNLLVDYVDAVASKLMDFWKPKREIINIENQVVPKG